MSRINKARDRLKINYECQLTDIILPTFQSETGLHHHPVQPHPGTAFCAFPSPKRRGKKNAQNSLLIKFWTSITCQIFALNLIEDSDPVPLCLERDRHRLRGQGEVVIEQDKQRS